MNCKKLLATALFTLGAWMNLGAAQAAPLTYYNFNYSANSGNGSVIGIIGVDGSIIKSISGTVSGFGICDGAYAQV